MANIISKDNLDDKVKTFLKNLKDTADEKVPDRPVQGGEDRVSS